MARWIQTPATDKDQFRYSAVSKANVHGIVEGYVQELQEGPFLHQTWLPMQANLDDIPNRPE